MMREGLNALVDAYRDGVISEEDAALLAEKIRAGGEESEWILKQLETAGFISQAVNLPDSDAFVRSFMERLHADESSRRFLDGFERKLRVETPLPRRVLKPRRMQRFSAPSSKPWFLFGSIAAGVLIAVVALLSGVKKNPEKRDATVAIKRDEPQAAAARTESIRPPEQEPAKTQKIEEVRPVQEERPAKIEEPKPKEDAPKREETVPKTNIETPAPKPAPEVKETAAVIAALEQGEASIVTDAGLVAARPGQELVSGQGLNSAGRAVVRFLDQTKLQLAENTLVAGLWEKDGKTVEISRGAVTCDVPKQPPNRPMIVRTLQAEVTVLGTQFIVSIEGDRTRVEVHKGLLQVRRRSDGKTVRLPAGRFVWVGGSGELVTEAVAVAATPKIYPNGGAFMGSVNVTLSTTTPDAVIRFTTNGSSPTASSPEYQGPFALTQSATIKAKAFREGAIESREISAIFTVKSGPGDRGVVNLLKNGGFEQGNLTDWTDKGGTRVESGAVYSGRYGAKYNSDKGPLDAAFPTVAGKPYYLCARVRIDREIVRPANGGLVVKVYDLPGGKECLMASGVALSKQNSPEGVWIRIDLTFSANMKETHVVIRNESDGQFEASLDDFIVSPNPIPKD